MKAQFPFGNQTPVLKGKISGTVLDSQDFQALPFVSVGLRKAKSSKIIDGVLSNEDGKFNFLNVAVGKYELIISFIGYSEKVVFNVETTLKDPDIDLKKIFLSSSEIALKDVTIIEKKALVENKADKLVYNAENDASIAGGDATDVLRKVPLLSVDLNGNVSLRGSQNVKILINGKPSGMFSNNIGDALKMFPADQIKRVEVITSPSAKYDAEGSGGIINIVTNKQNIEGIAGNVNTSVGIRQNSLFSSLNAGKGRLGSSFSAAIFYSNPATGNLIFERKDQISNIENIFKQNGDQRTSRLGGNGNASVFYDFNGYHSLNSSFNFRGFGFDVSGDVLGKLSVISKSIESIVDQYNRYNNGINFNGGFDWNTDYSMKFENQKDRELAIAVQYTKDNNDQDFSVIESHSNLTALNRDAKIINDGDNNEYTFQIDYTHPFKSAGKLETGVKSVIRKIVSDYENTLLSNGTYVRIDDFSDVFNYSQNIYAAYANQNYIFRQKWNFIAGLRYEHTSIEGSFLNENNQKFKDNYQNILPSFTISRNLPNFKSLKFSYNQRLQRPSLQFINPFNNNTDFLNRTIGNPYLDAELSHQFEVGYNTNFKGFAVFSTVYYKITENVIDQIIKVDSNVTINTFQNIGNNNSFGLNLFTSKTIKKLTIRGGGNIYSYNASGTIEGQLLSRKSYEYNLFFGGDFSFSGTLKADFFGFFKSPKRNLQGDNPAFSIYGMGIRKEFKNSSIGISLIEPHTPVKIFSSSLKGSNFTQFNQFTLPFRSIGINFRYKFGNVDFKERKTKIKNNDLKVGDDNMNSGNQTPRN